MKWLSRARTSSSLVCAVAITLGFASTALAGGYDVPVIYGPKYVGMGATGVGAADDAHAIYYNPAALGAIDVGSLELDAVYLTGVIHASPAAGVEPVASDRTNAPFAFAGGAARITPWLVAGFAAFPVAAAGATYHYVSPTGSPVDDSYAMVLAEFAPAVAFQVPNQRLSIGASYRMTMARVMVERGPAAPTHFMLRDRDFAAFRVGAHWRPIETLSIGLAFRSKVSLEPTTNDGLALGSTDLVPIRTQLLLAPRVSGGLRYDFSDFAVAADFHWIRNSLNRQSSLSTSSISLPIISDWSNSVELHLGGEARFLDGALPVRIGYIYDSRVTSKNYPSGFASPPAAGHNATVGIGWNEPSWHVDLSYTIGTSRGTVSQQDIDAEPLGACALCGGPGTYSAVVQSLSVGVAYSFDGPRAAPPASEPEPEAVPEPEPQPEPGLEPEPAAAPEPGLEAESNF